MVMMLPNRGEGICGAGSAGGGDGIDLSATNGFPQGIKQHCCAQPDSPPAKLVPHIDQNDRQDRSQGNQEYLQDLSIVIQSLALHGFAHSVGSPGLPPWQRGHFLNHISDPLAPYRLPQSVHSSSYTHWR